MKREASTETSSSTYSNITVEDGSSAASAHSLAACSTPPTSVDEATNATANASKNMSPSKTTNEQRRSARSTRTSITSYNINALSGSSRNTPSKLLNGMTDSPSAVGNSPRSSSRLGALKTTVSLTKSVLGKRGRDFISTGRTKIDRIAAARRKSLRPRVKPSDEPQQPEEPVSKRVRQSTQDAKASAEAQEEKVIAPPPKKRKIYLARGLYAGQMRDFNPRFSEAKNKKKRGQSNLPMPLKENKVLPLPMFMGEKLLNMGRDFKLPWGIVQPLQKAIKVEGWTKVSKSKPTLLSLRTALSNSYRSSRR